MIRYENRLILSYKGRFGSILEGDFHDYQMASLVKNIKMYGHVEGVYTWVLKIEQ